MNSREQVDLIDENPYIHLNFHWSMIEYSAAGVHKISLSATLVYMCLTRPGVLLTMGYAV